MCMKYINATTRCYKSVIKNDNGQILSYGEPFVEIIGNMVNGYAVIRNFVIQTEVSVLGTANPEHESENPISRKDKLHFTLRLTKCDPDETKRTGTDLASWEIDFKQLSEEKALSLACYPFYNKMFVTQVKEIEFPYFDTGKYVLKVLVRNTDNPEDDTIQSMSDFFVCIK